MLGLSRAETPPVVPARGYLEDIRRLMKGDYYIGRGSKQRGLKRSAFANPHKVSVHGRCEAVRRFGTSLAQDDELQQMVWLLSGCRLVCHCTPAQECHDDVLIQE